MERRGRAQEGKKSNNPLDDRIRCLEKSVFKVGAVSRTLISVDKLQETGYDLILTKNRPRNINMKTSEVMPLRINRGMFILDMWIWIPTSHSKSEECSDFVRQR